MTSYYAFFVDYLKYTEEDKTRQAVLITDTEVKAAYKQYLITYFSANALCGLSMNGVNPPSLACTNAKISAVSLVNSLGW